MGDYPLHSVRSSTVVEHVDMLLAANLSVEYVEDNLSVGKENLSIEHVEVNLSVVSFQGEPIYYWLDHYSFLKKQWSPLCIHLGDETCW